MEKRNKDSALTEPAHLTPPQHSDISKPFETIECLAGLRDAPGPPERAESPAKRPRLASGEEQSGGRGRNLERQKVSRNEAAVNLPPPPISDKRTSMSAGAGLSLQTDPLESDDSQFDAAAKLVSASFEDVGASNAPKAISHLKLSRKRRRSGGETEITEALVSGDSAVRGVTANRAGISEQEGATPVTREKERLYEQPEIHAPTTKVTQSTATIRVGASANESSLVEGVTTLSTEKAQSTLGSKSGTSMNIEVSSIGGQSSFEGNTTHLDGQARGKRKAYQYSEQLATLPFLPLPSPAHFNNSFRPVTINEISTGRLRQVPEPPMPKHSAQAQKQTDAGSVAPIENMNTKAGLGDDGPVAVASPVDSVVQADDNTVVPKISKHIPSRPMAKGSSKRSEQDLNKCVKCSRSFVKAPFESFDMCLRCRRKSASMESHRRTASASETSTPVNVKTAAGDVDPAHTRVAAREALGSTGEASILTQQSPGVGDDRSTSRKDANRPNTEQQRNGSEDEVDRRSPRESKAASTEELIDRGSKHNTPDEDFIYDVPDSPVGDRQRQMPIHGQSRGNSAVEATPSPPHTGVTAEPSESEGSNTSLVLRALRASHDQRLQTHAICTWISDRFSRYKPKGKWEASIAAVLSEKKKGKTNKPYLWVKEDRVEGDGGVGRGCWWCLADDRDDSTTGSPVQKARKRAHTRRHSIDLDSAAEDGDDEAAGSQAKSLGSSDMRELFGSSPSAHQRCITSDRSSPEDESTSLPRGASNRTARIKSLLGANGLLSGTASNRKIPPPSDSLMFPDDQGVGGVEMSRDQRRTALTEDSEEEVDNGDVMDDPLASAADPASHHDDAEDASSYGRLVNDPAASDFDKAIYSLPRSKKATIPSVASPAPNLPNNTMVQDQKDGEDKWDAGLLEYDEDNDKFFGEGAFFRAWPEYDPDRNEQRELEKRAKIAEIKARLPRKKVFGLVSSRIGKEGVGSMSSLAVPTDADAVGPANTMRRRATQDVTMWDADDDSPQPFDTLEELFGMPQQMIPVVHDNQLAYRDGARNPDGSLPRAKIIYKTGYQA